MTRPRYSYTGVAWIINDEEKKTNLISNWPGQTVLGMSNKVPTAVTYRTTEPYDFISWGFDATGRRDKEESEPFTWFKLLLQPPTATSEIAAANGSPELNTITRLLKAYGKTAEEVTADYLRRIWGYTRRQLRQILGDNFMTDYSVRVVLTVPAVWTPSSIKLARRLASRAGLPKNIELVQEPEAAAAAVLRESTIKPFLNVGDVITICDAGGGTCVSYCLILKTGNEE